MEKKNSYCGGRIRPRKWDVRPQVDLREESPRIPSPNSSAVEGSGTTVTVKSITDGDERTPVVVGAPPSSPPKFRDRNTGRCVHEDRAPMTGRSYCTNWATCIETSSRQ